jgi:hypothetical protein
MTATFNDWITARDAAALLGGVTPRTIARWAARGAFAARRFGPRVTRYDRAEILAYREQVAVAA